MICQSERGLPCLITDKQPSDSRFLTGNNGGWKDTEWRIRGSLRQALLLGTWALTGPAIHASTFTMQKENPKTVFIKYCVLGGSQNHDSIPTGMRLSHSYCLQRFSHHTLVRETVCPENPSHGQPGLPWKRLANCQFKPAFGYFSN